MSISSPPDAQGGRVLMVASDRVSAFDVVMPTPITGKGRMLTEIATWWFGFIRDKHLCETHLLSTNVGDLPPEVTREPEVREFLNGRITIGRACDVIPVECVVRGYLEGSGGRNISRPARSAACALPRGSSSATSFPSRSSRQQPRRPSATTRTSPSIVPRRSSASRPPRRSASCHCPSTPRRRPTPSSRHHHRRHQV